MKVLEATALPGRLVEATGDGVIPMEEVYIIECHEECIGVITLLVYRGKNCAA